MPARTFALKVALPLLTLGLLLVGPQPAMATEVMCSNMWGDCTVSNNGFDEVECTCDGGGFGSTGGEDYSMLTEAELMAVCLDHLMWCEEQGGTGDTGWGDTGDTGWSDTGDTGWGETGMVDETAGDGDGDGDGDNSTTGDGDGDSGGDGDGDGDSSGDGDGDGDSNGGDGDGDSTGDGDGDGDSTGDGDGDGDTNSDTNSDDGNNQEESGDSGESGTGADTGATEDGAGGCSCATANQGPGIGLMLLSLFGLVRLRRRESVS